MQAQVSGDCMLTYDVVYLFIVWTHKCDVMTCFVFNVYWSRKNVLL